MSAVVDTLTPVHPSAPTPHDVPAAQARPGRTVPGGLLVSLEGGDGAGKSSHLRRLADWLTGHGLTVVTTREPGGTDLGRTLRREVLHGQDLDPRTEALLYAADRAHHVASLVRPALAAGSVVVTDRYLDSSVAYQGSGRDLGRREVADLNRWATGGLLPALTVLLDLDPVEGLARAHGRAGTLDRLESAGDDFHRRTRQAFLDLAAAEPDRWLVLDATAEPEQVAGRIRARVAELLAARGLDLTDGGRP